MAITAKTMTSTPEVTRVVRVCNLRGGSLKDRVDCMSACSLTRELTNLVYSASRMNGQERSFTRLISHTPTFTDRDFNFSLLTQKRKDAKSPGKITLRLCGWR